jgi:hypothetical protein
MLRLRVKGTTLLLSDCKPVQVLRNWSHWVIECSFCRNDSSLLYDNVQHLLQYTHLLYSCTGSTKYADLIPKILYYKYGSSVDTAALLVLVNLVLPVVRSNKYTCWSTTLPTTVVETLETCRCINTSNTVDLLDKYWYLFTYTRTFLDEDEDILSYVYLYSYKYLTTCTSTVQVTFLWWWMMMYYL